jgi:hypothetical protein
MGQGATNQITNCVPGMLMVAAYARGLNKATKASICGTNRRCDCNLAGTIRTHHPSRQASCGGRCVPAPDSRFGQSATGQPLRPEVGCCARSDSGTGASTRIGMRSWPNCIAESIVEHRPQPSREPTYRSPMTDNSPGHCRFRLALFAVRANASGLAVRA